MNQPRDPHDRWVEERVRERYARAVEEVQAARKDPYAQGRIEMEEHEIFLRAALEARFIRLTGHDLTEDDRTEDESERAEWMRRELARTLPARPSWSSRLVRAGAALAAVVLGVVLVRGLTSGPNAAGAAAASENAAAADGVYLGEERPRAAQPTAFPGSLQIDRRGGDGVVLLTLFDLEGEPDRAVFEELVEGEEWTPSRPLPRKFRVLVDRPADDGVSREELHCEDYFLP